MVDSSAPIARRRCRISGSGGHRALPGQVGEKVAAPKSPHGLRQERHLLYGCCPGRANRQEVRIGAGVTPSISSGAPGRARRSGLGAIVGAGAQGLVAIPQAVTELVTTGRPVTVSPSLPATIESQFPALGTVGGLFGVPVFGARRGTDPD